FSSHVSLLLPACYSTRNQVLERPQPSSSRDYLYDARAHTPDVLRGAPRCASLQRWNCTRVGVASIAGCRASGRCIHERIAKNSARRGQQGSRAPALAEPRKEAAGCPACSLYKTATQTVFGEGPQSARVMIIGEQPGDQEDRQG